MWLLMGTDMFLTLHQWHEPERILALAGVCAFGRTAITSRAQVLLVAEVLGAVVEDGRPAHPVLVRAPASCQPRRLLAYSDLDGAVGMGASLSMQEMVQRGKELHHDTHPELSGPGGMDGFLNRRL